jgi:hypothetical protein
MGKGTPPLHSRPHSGEVLLSRRHAVFLGAAPNCSRASAKLNRLRSSASRPLWDALGIAQDGSLPVFCDLTSQQCFLATDGRLF